MPVKRKLPSLHRLSPYFTVAVFCFAGVVIYLQLRAHSLSEIASDIRGIPSTKVLTALALVVPGLLALACYDLVAAKYLKLPLRWWQPLGTGLLGYSITNTTGHAVVVGGILRLRLYPRWGVKAGNIGEIVGFGVLTYYLGLSCTAALGVSASRAAVWRRRSPTSRMSERCSPTPGFGTRSRRCCSALMVTWFVLLATVKRTIRIRKHDFRLPKPIIGLLQVIVSCADLCIVASVLWVLLPSHDGMDWLSFVGIFAVIQFISLLSAVPGGIGVFEGIMLVVLAPVAARQSEVFAMLLTFRAIYYLIPFALGGLTFLLTVLIQRQEHRPDRQFWRGESMIRCHTDGIHLLIVSLCALRDGFNGMSSPRDIARTSPVPRSKSGRSSIAPLQRGARCHSLSPGR